MRGKKEHCILQNLMDNCYDKKLERQKERNSKDVQHKNLRQRLYI